MNVAALTEKFDAAKRGLCLRTDDKNHPLCTLDNVSLILRGVDHPSWSNVLAFDEFSMRTVALKVPPSGGHVPTLPHVWTDTDDKVAACWLQRNVDWKSGGPNVELVSYAVEVAAHARRFHPVRALLDRCEKSWDGQARVQTWLTDYLGVEASPYSQAIGQRWLVSAVARIYEPGCKVDTMPVLEGNQGLGKSTAVRIMAGTEYFTDELPDLRSKDAALQLSGRWFVEVGELDVFSRAEVSTLKAFVSRSTDVFRPPFGRRTGDFPRQCIFTGTTNADRYLRDETGNRRFWPVACVGRIDNDGLSKVRDQLWGEAVTLYRSGARWWLDSAEDTGVIADATAEQDARYQGDEWEAKIVPYLLRNEDGVSVGDVLEHVLNIDPARWTQVDQNRVARCLTHLGWFRRLVRRPGGRVWRYVPGPKWEAQ